MNFFDHTFFGYKRPISSPENARTENPAAFLEGFRRNPRVPLSAGLPPLNMVSLINACRFEDFADTVSDGDRLFVTAV